MILKRLSATALVAATVSSCDLGPRARPSWVGQYTLRADTVQYCVEGYTPGGFRSCHCTTPGYLQGTLTLTATADGKPSGEVKLRECPPGATCGTEVAYAVIPFNGPPDPNARPGERLSFCAGKCPTTGNDGGIEFIDAPIPANPLVGWFSRADGNIRGCGADYGPFTAAKQ